MKVGAGGVGLYVHVPFCERKCPYCGFFSLPLTDEQSIEEYWALLLEEAGLRRRELAPGVRTVYFGGGTPSLVAPGLIRDFLATVDQLTELAPDVEVTLEVNPGAVGESDLRSYLEAGVNRLSIGVQSFAQEDLQALGRLHSATEARRTVESARKVGFSNVSIDLIYGIPDQSRDRWLENLATAHELGVQHISAYELTVEPGTPLAKRVKEGSVQMPAADVVAEMFRLAHDFLVSRGFVHYEVSNYALPGHECRHNWIYWQRGAYVGLGPPAHSFAGRRRAWNPADLGRYMQALRCGILPTEGEEHLSSQSSALEVLYLGLRTLRGVDLQALEEGTGVTDLRQRAESAVGDFQDFLRLRGDRLCPTVDGLLHADHLAVELAERLFSDRRARVAASGRSPR